MKHTARIAAILILILLTVPGLAQEALPEATVEALPVAVVGTDVAPPDTTVVCEAGASCAIDNTPVDKTPAADNTLSYVIIGVLVLVLLVGGAFSTQIIRIVGGLISPEAAAILFRAGARLVLERGFAEAELTVTEVDDDFFKAEAEKRGFEVYKDATGHYRLKDKEKLPAPAVPANPTPYAVTASGTPIPNSATITNVHELGGAGPVNGEEFRP